MIKKVLSIILLFVISGCAEKQYPLNLLGENFSCTIMLDLKEYQSPQDVIKNTDWSNNPDTLLYFNSLAALELQKYMSKLVDSDSSCISIVDDDSVKQGTIIHIGIPENKKLSKISKKVKKHWKKVPVFNGAFLVDTFHGENFQLLVLSAQKPIGHLYAVYDLLDRFGVRWISFEDQDEFIPVQRALALASISELIHPEFKIRGIESNSLAVELSSQEMVDFVTWMRRMRLNLLVSKNCDPVLLAKNGVLYGSADGYSLSYFLNPDDIYPYNHADFSGNEGRDPDPYQKSELYQGDVNNDNKLSYIEAHPEWFGVSKDSSKSQSETPYCLSVASLQDELLKNIIHFISSTEKFDIFRLLFSKHEYSCDCAGCRDNTPAEEKYFTFLNKLNFSLNQAYLKNIITKPVLFQAYFENNLGSIPLKSSPTVVALINDRCYNHPIFFEQCTEINANDYNILKESLKSDFSNTSDFILIDSFNKEPFKDLPSVFATVIGYDFPEYEKLGIQGVVLKNPKIISSGVFRLMNYQFSRQSWNPNENLQILFSDYFSIRYAGVEKIMQEYYNKLEEATGNIQAWRLELCPKINSILSQESDTPLFPLERFRNHLHIEEFFPLENDGVDWEKTYQIIHDARHVIDYALEQEVSDKVLNVLLEDENQLRYIEMMINLYDNVIRLLTLDEDEPEMREEAIIRLRDARTRLESYSLVISGKKQNAFHASGIEESVNQLLQKFDKRKLFYKRVYQ